MASAGAKEKQASTEDINFLYAHMAIKTKSRNVTLLQLDGVLDLLPGHRHTAAAIASMQQFASAPSSPLPPMLPAAGSAVQTTGQHHIFPSPDATLWRYYVHRPIRKSVRLTDMSMITPLLLVSHDLLGICSIIAYLCQLIKNHIKPCTSHMFLSGGAPYGKNVGAHQCLNHSCSSACPWIGPDSYSEMLRTFESRKTGSCRGYLT